MDPELGNPLDRDDGRPWVPWESTPSPYRSLAGFRERVELVAWYDFETQALRVTLTRYDESQRHWAPCWAQVAYVDVGPFMARNEIRALFETAAEEVESMCGLD